MDVDIDLIKPSPYQPRLFFEVDDLKEEIERDGLLSALVVRKRDEYYELLDGERRLRTLRELGWKRVPIDVREVDDRTARRAVYKLNKIRESYSNEDEARYFKKLFDEGMKPYQIETELGVKHSWVQACLNVFLFPKEIQDHIFLPGRANRFFYISDICDLEGVINRNPNEAIEIGRQIINERLSQAEKEKLIGGRVAVIDEERLKVAEEAVSKITPEVGRLETPEDYERAGEVLRKEAKRRAEEAMTSQEKAALEAERKAQAEAQALAKAEREEEKRQRQAEEERRRQERAEKRARAELKADKTFVQEALRAMPEEERIEVLGLVPSPEKPKEPKGLSEQFQEVLKEASQLVSRIERLRAESGFEELDLKPFAIDLYMLADAFTGLSREVADSHGEKK